MVTAQSLQSKKQYTGSEDVTLGKLDDDHGQHASARSCRAAARSRKVTSVPRT